MNGMTRRLALSVPIALICSIILGGGSASAAPAPELTHPASSSVQTGGVVRVAYTLPAMPDVNSAHLTFTPVVGAISHQYGMYFGASSDDFTFPVSLPSSSPKFYSGGGVALPDGLYNVILDYTTGGTPQTLTNTNVRIKNSTTPPSLISPQGSTTVNQFPISYSLPDTPNPGSTTLRFTELDGPVACTLTLSDIAAATVRSFTINPANPTAPSEVVSASPTCDLQDALYEIELSYSDTYSNPAATAYAGNVTLDTVTAPPTLLSPVSDADKRGNLAIGYSLGEAGLFGSVKLHFEGPSASSLTLNNFAAGEQYFTLDPASLASSPAVVSVVGDAALASGLYGVALTYQDAVGNPAASSTVATNVQIGPAPVAPPATGGGDGGAAITPVAKQCFSVTKKARFTGKLKKKKVSVSLAGKPSADGQSIQVSLVRTKNAAVTLTVGGKKVKGPKVWITMTDGAQNISARIKYGSKMKTLKLALPKVAC
jgi:hypothetical protein